MAASSSDATDGASVSDSMPEDMVRAVSAPPSRSAVSASYPANGARQIITIMMLIMILGAVVAVQHKASSRW